MTFDELEWKSHPLALGADQAIARFDNGYAASVVRGWVAFTDGGTYELAVLHNGKLCYDTPVTDDVLGHLSVEEVEQALSEIEALPKAD